MPKNPKKFATKYAVRTVRETVFLPVLRISRKEKQKGKTILVNSDSVKMTLDSFLDQTDMNILLGIEAVAQRKIRTREGCLFYAFSPRQLQKVLGIDSKSKHEWIKEKIRYLKSRNIETTVKHDNHEITINSNPIRKWGYVREIKNLKDKRGETVFGDNSLFFVTFENEFATFLERDIQVCLSREIFRKLVEIKDGYTQAIVKFILSQKAKPDEYKIALDTILEKVGVNKENTPRKKYERIKRNIRKNKERLKEFNITIDENDIIHYSHSDCVYHSLEQQTGSIPKLIGNIAVEKDRKRSRNKENPTE